MPTVLNVLELLSFIFGGLIYFFGLGWSVLFSFLWKEKINKELYWVETLPLILVFGLIVNYGITLLFQLIGRGLIVGVVLSLLGIAHFAYHSLQSSSRARFRNKKIDLWVGIISINILFLVPILKLPLIDWDARSIWFFHAKMIFFAETIGRDAGWQYISLLFSHPDYPKLIPLIAGQIAYIAGFWNEYLPKIALFMALFPALIWLFNFSKRRISFLFLLVFIPLSFNKLMWNGYMDGLLALYFSVSLLFLGRYVKSSSVLDISSSAASAVFLLYLKNEGALAFLILFLFMLLNFLVKEKGKLIGLRYWPYVWLSSIASFPLFMWMSYKERWGISNDLTIGTPESFLRLSERIADRAYISILEASYDKLEVGLMLFGVLFSAMIIWEITVPKEIYPVLGVGTLYFLGMVVVYLLTPHDLNWHLGASVGRTMLPVNGSLYVLTYFLYSEIEDKWRTQYGS